jgi:uncharacterized protein (DUF342 family)
VGGVLRTKFIENCRVACRKQVAVTSDILNSSIFTLESVVMGDKGEILGGDIHAVHGIRTAFIGRKAGRTTRLHCGIDFTVQQQKEKAGNQLRMVGERIRKLQEILHPGPTQKKPDGALVRKVNDALKNLTAQQKVLTDKLNELLARLYSDEKAVVEISGEIAPDSLIEICDVSLYVTEPMKHVRIRLNRALGELVSEALPK